MAGSFQKSTSFFTLADALLRKNIALERRNSLTSLRLLFFPVFMFLMLDIIRRFATDPFSNPQPFCGKNSWVHGSLDCPLPRPPRFPALLQVPNPKYRSVRTSDTPFTDLPDKSCRISGSCPVTVLFTGGNRTFGESLSGNLFMTQFTMNFSDIFDAFANVALGSSVLPPYSNIDRRVFNSRVLYIIQPKCQGDSIVEVPIDFFPTEPSIGLLCVEGLPLWRNDSSVINTELHKGYRLGNLRMDINEIMAAYDFLNSNESNFNVTIWYNSSYRVVSPDRILRISRSINLVSNAYLQFLRGAGVKILFNFVKDIPQFVQLPVPMDMSYTRGSFFTWIVLQPFPVILTSLVYEKQQNLRIMMKMHGLSDGPYWMISYAFFLLLSSAYMLCFVLFGYLIGLAFFTLNSYSLQFVFYFMYFNLQIAFAFLSQTFFSNVRTAAVTGNIYVFSSGLLGTLLFHRYLQASSFPRFWITVMEIYPGFSLYRGLYEFGQAAAPVSSEDGEGLHWIDLNDTINGMKELFIIMFIEWFVVLLAAYYFDQIVTNGGGVGKHPLFFLHNLQKKRLSSIERPSLQRQASKIYVEMEKPDVFQERKKVEQLLLNHDTSHAIICDDLTKIYSAKDGNPENCAVRGLSFALPPGECFGMIGANGAGKTSFINMMIGLTAPTSGTAFVQTLDITTGMEEIYMCMGVCPQYDLLWEQLTGTEHLMFYGRLKNLKGAALTKAVAESLRKLNLGRVAQTKVKTYSGGMKRRLSVAISLIGDPRVIYLDEPSTGLDPASRIYLWDAIRSAKLNSAIILNTHLMEEAEAICDRLGILVDGSLQCIGNVAELKGRFGGSYVFTIATSTSQVKEAEKLAYRLSPNAKKLYHLAGTQKFELSKLDVKIADVFQAVENGKRMFPIHAWGIADATLEDIFITIATEAQAFNAQGRENYLNSF